MSGTVRLTISLPRDLLSFADRLSRERNSSRSGVIASILRDLAEERERAAMIEGYEAMAEQGPDFADMAISLADEVLPEWK